MAQTVNIYEAKTHLSALVEKAARGEEIVIAKAGKPIARLVPLTQRAPAPRQFGQNLLGISYIAPDFDAPLPEEIFASFYGEPVEPKSEPTGPKSKRMAPKR
jgi:prevent-host-death family protein